MPKLICRCGYVHNLSPIPDEGWQTVRDSDIETYVQASFNPEVTVQLAGLLYECHNCGRLAWKKPGAITFDFFKPEPT